MCMFTGEVDVSNTNIFVARVGVAEQLTVYSNTVKLPSTHVRSRVQGTWGDGTPQVQIQVQQGTRDARDAQDVREPKPTSMVLPIPLNGGDASSVRMVDMSADADFFQRLAEAVAVPHTNSRSGANAYLSCSANTLEVHRCGPYSYSVVPDVAAFENLDGDVFGPSVGLAGALKERYSAGYAFLVCIIDASSAFSAFSAFSPIAYLHPMASSALFVPTLHEHGSGIGQFADDWDHRVYSLDTTNDTVLLDGRKVECVTTRAHAAPVLRWSFAYSRLDWSRLTCRRIKGRQPNGDIWLRP